MESARRDFAFCAKETSRKFAAPGAGTGRSVDARDDRAAREDAGLDRRELGGAGAPARGGGVAREREERVAVAVLGGGEPGVQLARPGVVERAGEQAEPLGRPALDDREHQQAVEQAIRLAVPDLGAQRRRVVVAVVVARRLAA